jgi:hypothetical protein
MVDVVYAGFVYVVAGSSTAGTIDGFGTAAQFTAIYGIGLSTTGKLYVADLSGHRVRLLDTSGWLWSIILRQSKYICNRGYCNGLYRVLLEWILFDFRWDSRKLRTDTRRILQAIRVLQ